MLKTLRPASDFIGSGVEITVYSLAGREAIKYKTQERVTYLTLGHALLQRLSAQTSIPQRCFTLTMNPPSKVGNGSERIDVQYVTHAMEDDCESREEECSVCGDPCLDADVEGALSDKKVTRYTNCVLCEPCYLCGDCRVSVRGKYYCFDCIDREAAGEVPVRALKRMDYTMPAKAAMIRQAQQEIRQGKTKKAASEAIGGVWAWLSRAHMGGRFGLFSTCLEVVLGGLG